MRKARRKIIFADNGLKKAAIYPIVLVATLLICSCSHLNTKNATRKAGHNENSRLGLTGTDTTDELQYSKESLSNGPQQTPLDGGAGSDVSSNDDETTVQSTLESDITSDKEAQSYLDEALDFCEVSQALWQKGELDNAFEALDKAYSLILETDTKQDAKLIQQREDLRFLISKRILEIYASRNIVVNGNHDEIPMEMNQHIQSQIKAFTTGREKNSFKRAYQRSGKYRPFIAQALKEAGLPNELSWLPLIESSFKVKALSKARALGLWQFIPSTGYKFGLKRTSYIDERIDFVKSTYAAIDYLKELHSIFGDWATVLAAYNCGEGRVLRVIRTQNVNYLDDFWDLYQRLPRETALYVPRFFATLHVVKNAEKYGLDELELDPPIAFDTVEITRQSHLKDIAKVLGMDAKELHALNPQLRYQILPPEPYTLRVPQGKGDHLLASLDAIPTSTLPQRSYIYHRVRKGQTLGTIARRYGTSVGTIMRANNLRSSHLIRVGKSLKIPAAGGATKASNNVTPPVNFSGTHIVRKGDSLWIIAKRYGTTVKQISGLNNLASGDLYIGQRLKIPGYKPEPLPNADQLTAYYVRRGDSPYAIALKHNMQLERFLRINRLTPRSKIYPGQKLFIE